MEAWGLNSGGGGEGRGGDELSGLRSSMRLDPMLGPNIHSRLKSSDMA